MCHIHILWYKHFYFSINRLDDPIECGNNEMEDDTHDRVLGISVNIPTQAFCPPMCILFIFSESCFYTFGRMGGD